MSSPVLLCTDGSDLSLAAVRAGVDVIDPASTFVIVTVMDEPDPMLVTGGGLAGGVMSNEEFAQAEEAAATEANEIIETSKASLGLPDAGHQVLQGDPGSAICRLADELSARAIVLGSRGRGGLRRAVLGSVSDHVVRNAPCPVVVTGGHAVDED